MNKCVKTSLVLLGVFCIITAVFGLFYNYSSLTEDLSGTFAPNKDIPYFRHAFYTMLTISTFCYLLLIYFGVVFLRRDARFAWFFISLMMFEIVYLLLLSLSWFLLPTSELRLSVAAATGVANGGLMAQFIVLFPLWGSILAIWARKRSQSSV